MEKKIIVLLICFVAVGLIFGCTETTNSDNTTNNDSTNVVTQPDNTNNEINSNLNEALPHVLPTFNNYCDLVIKKSDMMTLCKSNDWGVSGKNYINNTTGIKSDLNLDGNFSYCLTQLNTGPFKEEDFGQYGKVAVWSGTGITIKILEFDSIENANNAFDKMTDYVEQYSTEMLTIGDKSVFNTLNDASNSYVDILLDKKWIQLNYMLGKECSKQDLLDITQRVTINLK